MKHSILGLLAVVLWASVGSAAPTPDISVPSAEFRGIMLSADGTTPSTGVTVRVWDTQTEKVIFRTQTDQNGEFAIPELTDGDRYITASSVRIDVRLLRSRAGIIPQPIGIVIVVPRTVIPELQIRIPSAATEASRSR
jgi:hypothetical protein